MKLFVGNLSHELTEEELKSALEEYGQVESAVIIKDKYTGNSKGFGFVEMSTKDEAKAAIEGLNGKELKGRPLTVNEARPRTENRGGFGGNRGGGGRGGFGGGNRGGQGGGRGGYGGGRGGQGGNRGGYGGGKGGQGRGN